MKTVAVSGSTCVGKTTLIKQLAPYYKNIFVIQEQAEKNPFFHRCFSDGKESSFKSQLMFYIEHLNNISQLYKNTNNPEIIFFDRFIDEHKLISKFRYGLGELTESEYYICKNLAESIESVSPQINKIIYLHCSLEVSIERKKMRNKEWDNDIDVKKIKELMNCYDDWFNDFTKKSPTIQCISINTDSSIDIKRIIDFINL